MLKDAEQNASEDNLLKGYSILSHDVDELVYQSEIINQDFEALSLKNSPVLSNFNHLIDQVKLAYNQNNTAAINDEIFDRLQYYAFFLGYERINKVVQL